MTGDCGTRLSVRGGVAVCQPPVHRWQAAGRAESPTVALAPSHSADRTAIPAAVGDLI